MSLRQQSCKERYVKDAFQWMVPFLHRCERQKEGAAERLLRDFLVGLACSDLAFPLLIFQHSKPDVSATKKPQTIILHRNHFRHN